MNRWPMGPWRRIARLVVVAAISIAVGVLATLRRPLILTIPEIPRDLGVALALSFLTLLWLDIFRRARFAASAQSAPWLLTENLIIWLGFLVGWFARLKGVIGFANNRGWLSHMAGLSFDLRVVTVACWIATTMLTLTVLYRQSKSNTHNISPNQ